MVVAFDCEFERLQVPVKRQAESQMGLVRFF